MAQATGARQDTARAELRPAAELDPRRAVFWGLIGGLWAVLVAAIGMLEAFVVRPIVPPYLSFSYVLLGLIPFSFGYLAGRPPPQLEGFAAAVSGPRNVVAGVVAGLLSGAVLSGFVVLGTTFNLRAIFINMSPGLFDLLTFGQAIGPGIVWILVGSAALGIVGGLLQLLAPRWRKAALMALVWVLLFGLLQELIARIFVGSGIPLVNRVLYVRTGGLSPWGVLIVGALFFVVYSFLETKRRDLREQVASLTPTQRRTWITVGLVVLVLVVAVLPQILGNFLSEVLNLAGLFLLMALGLNIVVGYAGLLDLGYVAFFAVGAYAGAVLMSPASPRWSPELTFWAALPFVLMAAACAGIMVGTPVLRMRGDYLAIVTLGFGEIARLLLLSDWLKPAFGGAQGIIRIPNVAVGPVEITRPMEFVYPLFAFILLAAYVSWALQNSRIGRGWMAMREDEPVAEALGVNIVAAKLWAFVIGAMLASFGGALFATKIGSVFPHTFQILVSITALVIIIVGGIGSIPGVAVGALILIGLPELLREFQEFRLLLYGALLIFMMLKKPEGFIPSKRRARELHQDEMLQDAWLADQAEAAS